MRHCNSHGDYTRVGRCPVCKEQEHQAIPISELIGAAVFLYLSYLWFSAVFIN